MCYIDNFPKSFKLMLRNRKKFILSVLTTLVVIFSSYCVERTAQTDKSKQEKAKLERLKSLPYLGFVVDDPNPQKNGVTLFEKNLANKGINIYNSYKLAGAYLVDMKGKILHTWSPEKSHWHWHHVKMLEKGDLLVVVKDVMLMRIDWDSNIKWIIKKKFHHDVSIAENGDIYSLTRDTKWINYKSRIIPILDDYLTILTQEGKIKKKISFYELLKNKIPSWMLKKTLKRQINQSNKKNINEEIKSGSIFDIYHVNAVEIINKNFNEIFKRGNILFCAKIVNRIGVIDIKKQNLLWSWGKGILQQPHHPTLLENGNILIFDNGVRRKYSRVIEYNPSANKIEWEYKGKSPDSFFSRWGGANQRLPNGNTLITESAKGRVFEITRNGKIVWDFYNPYRSRDNDRKRATIYRMMRIINMAKYPILKQFYQN